MNKLVIFIFILCINSSSCLRISNFFRKKICHSRISINQNNIHSDKNILKKNDKFYIYIEGEKSLKAKIIKEYKSNKDIQNTGYNDDIQYHENNSDLEKDIQYNGDLEKDIQYNDIEQKYKNNIINIPGNILSLFFFLFLYLSMNSYMFGFQLRKKIDNIIRLEMFGRY